MLLPDSELRAKAARLGEELRGLSREYSRCTNGGASTTGCTSRILGRSSGRPAAYGRSPPRGRTAFVRQLRGAPDAVQVTARFKGSQTTFKLREVRKDRKRLLLPADPRNCPSQFTVAVDRPMGAKQGRGKGSFVASVETLVQAFYTMSSRTLPRGSRQHRALRPQKKSHLRQRKRMARG